MSAPFKKARVKYCNEPGWFFADILVIKCVNVVHSLYPVDKATLVRVEMETITHQIVDTPETGFWRPDLGVFVVPISQVLRFKHPMEV